jgi:hypothetical protein
LAIVHSRLTVAGEIPNAAAVSSIVRPPKKRSSTIFASPAPFAGEMARRDGPELVVDERDELLKSLGAARLPLVQQTRDLDTPVGHGHSGAVIACAR